jgi:hypothetical protein
MARDLAVQLCPCGSPTVGFSSRDARMSKWCAKHNLWASQIKNRYGCDDEMIESLMVLKEDGCSICGGHHLLGIDHCHDTGLVRGWLCRRCNTALGFFNDDPERLAVALRYLQGGVF